MIAPPPPATRRSARLFRASLVASLALSIVAIEVHAQSYPSRPVKLIVPFPAAGVADLLARILAPELGKRWGQPVVVENRTGANTIVGAEMVARAAPDGSTLLLTGDQTVTSNVFLYKLPYDPEKDLIPVSLLTNLQYIFAVNPTVPVNSVTEYIALAKAKPGVLTYGSSGNGSPQHLAAALFAQMAGIKLTHIPYKGGGPATIALLGGELNSVFGGMSNLIPHARAGKIRALGVSGSKRLSALPEVPTVAEAGVPGFNVVSWLGILAPSGVPSEILGKIAADFNYVLQLPEIQNNLAPQGFESVGSTPGAFADVIKSDLDKWGKVIKDVGVRPGD